MVSDFFTPVLRGSFKLFFSACSRCRLQDVQTLGGDRCRQPQLSQAASSSPIQEIVSSDEEPSQFASSSSIHDLVDLHVPTDAELPHVSCLILNVLRFIVL